ncbi:putative esterase [Sphaerotilus natans subsp. natans DSM 6575]|uniref:Putative esterase n=1 Tax=Sphaerotilus natans subsp. natans DSM 6575 TaxID=1286631 RepID=A0A059KQ84_9BURK|nr:alpha/beta hydrolase family protein [Sphaerotilus natans]KDB53581.1 putative esterase [Sphaerotilus natans subsp. natans DSM 6575]SIR99207.1 Alpha/beta hydrolase family protein [Sphaerotilus natans]
MSALVLIHGAWHGAWCWRRVLPGLRDAGHSAHAVTLTGVGERAHLLRPDLRLRDHIADVLGLIEAEELDDLVLVGHSYGGLVMTGVADALLARGLKPRHLVYVDAVTPHPGESWSSQHAPDTVRARLQAAAQRPDGAMPPPDAAVFGLDGADRDWVNRRQTPQPAGVYQDRLDFDAARIAALPRTFIDCTAPALPTIAVMRERVRREPGWQVVELATGHDPMISAPEALVALLLDCAR